MKQLSPELDAHLKSGSTTLCWCWRLTRRDGVVTGFTDHDRDLSFDETVFEAAAGFTASDVKESVGLSVDNLDVTGALSSEHLSEDDLAAGRYDDAKIEIFRVNWTDPAQRVLMRSGSLGEVTRAGAMFSAEVRGLAHYLQQPKGRLFQLTCDADLGDGRCGVDLDTSALTGNGVIDQAENNRRIVVTGLDSFAHDFFTRGVVTISDGAMEGLKREVKLHANRDSVVSLELWSALPDAPAAGVSFSVTAGCDKRFATCRNKFSNGVNFRGFPTMPGNAFLTKVGRR